MKDFDKVVDLLDNASSTLIIGSDEQERIRLTGAIVRLVRPLRWRTYVLLYSSYKQFEKLLNQYENDFYLPEKVRREMIERFQRIAESGVPSAKDLQIVPDQELILLPTPEDYFESQTEPEEFINIMKNDLSDIARLGKTANVHLVIGSETEDFKYQDIISVQHKIYLSDSAKEKLGIEIQNGSAVSVDHEGNQLVFTYI